jgi:CRP-like cAMP-binding protein
MATGRRTATAQRQVSAAPAGAKRQSERVDPAFHRAILKIALELKKPSAESYDAIVERTIRTLRLDAAAFRRYLGENGARNMSLLLATARGPGL